MRTLDLERAAGEIAQGCDNARRRNRPSPFFFIVGAGISHPPLPLADKIEQECREEAAQYGRTEESEKTNPLDLYSHWFSCAFPHPVDRQRYLRDLMENAYISRANFRLAHLMLERSVTNIVVTTNFDDLLSRALTLFGQRHILCDHPRTVERVDPESDDVQIIHVHGTYWFYDCCNLRQEVELRSRSERDTALTMSALLDNILGSRSPLVIGYSGWEGDVIMTALRRRLCAGLRYNLYWFCYRPDDLKALPAWLRDHPNVCFVLPDQLAEPAGTNSASPAILDLGLTSIQKQTVLSATAVFDCFIRRFSLDAPKLTVDPLGFLSDQLQQFLSHDSPVEIENDLYAIRGVVQEIESARRRLEAAAPRTSPELELQVLRDHLRRSDYRSAVSAASAIKMSQMSDLHLREVFAAMVTAGTMLNDGSAEELLSCDLAMRAADRLTQKTGGGTDLDEQLAATMLKKGLSLLGMEKFEDAAKQFDAIARRHKNSKHPALRLATAMALVNKGAALEAVGRLNDALNSYDNVLLRQSQISEHAPELLARAIYNKAVALGKLGRTDEELGSYDELLNKFANDGLISPERILKTLFNKAIALADAGRLDEAQAAYDQLIVRADMPDDELSRVWAAKALFNKAVLLSLANKPSEELAVYDVVISRLGTAPPSELVVKALLNKAICLDTANVPGDHRELCRELVGHCEGLSSSSRDTLLAKSMLVCARACSKAGSPDEGEAICDALLARFTNHTEPQIVECVTRATRMRFGREQGIQSAMLRLDATKLFRRGVASTDVQ